MLALGLAALVATGLRTPGVETIFYGVVLLADEPQPLPARGAVGLAAAHHRPERVHGRQLGGPDRRAGRGADRRRGRHRAAADPRSSRCRTTRPTPSCSWSPPPASWSAPRWPCGSRGSQLGPDDVEPTRARDIVAGLAEALAHLRERRAAGLGLLTIGAHRIVYGIVTVATILVYRNYFHTLDQVDAAIADLGLLVVITGAGFVFAAVVTPPVTARIGVRGWIIVCLVGSAVFQISRARSTPRCR